MCRDPPAPTNSLAMHASPTTNRMHGLRTYGLGRTDPPSSSFCNLPADANTHRDSHPVAVPCWQDRPLCCLPDPEGSRWKAPASSSSRAHAVDRGHRPPGSQHQPQESWQAARDKQQPGRSSSQRLRGAGAGGDRGRYVQTVLLSVSAPPCRQPLFEACSSAPCSDACDALAAETLTACLPASVAACACLRVSLHRRTCYPGCHICHPPVNHLVNKVWNLESASPLVDSTAFPWTPAWCRAAFRHRHNKTTTRSTCRISPLPEGRLTPPTTAAPSPSPQPSAPAAAAASLWRLPNRWAPAHQPSAGPAPPAFLVAPQPPALASHQSRRRPPPPVSRQK